MSEFNHPAGTHAEQDYPTNQSFQFTTPHIHGIHNSRTSTLENTHRSSVTYIDREDASNELEKSRSLTPKLRLAEVLSQDAEEAIERYGGDNIHEPSVKSPTPNVDITTPKLPRDPNMADWDGPDDPENPQNWSKSYKWLITMVCILMCVNVTFASSAPSSTATEVMAEFNISSELSYLITTTLLLGYVFGPLFWGPGSELVGRKKVFIVSMVSYTLFILGQALAQNIETLLVTRFLSGFFAVAPLTNSGGVIADIWAAEGRGLAVSMFTASVFLGPVLGPIVAGFITDSYLSWRWLFWIMMMFAGFCTLVMIPLIPETYAPVILQRKVKRMRKADPAGTRELYAEHERQDWSVKGILHRTLFRPFHMLALEPVLVLVTVYISLVYGLLYALFQAIPIVFVRVRGFTVAQDGLIFIGIGIGTTIGSIINVITTSHYPKLIEKWKGFPPPEDRLFGSMIGSPLLVIGIFLLGWTGHYASISWYVPALSMILVGTGISSIFMSFLSYLVDTYLMYSASALAANTMVRSAVAAGFPLFTVQMFTNLGVSWACTLVGLLALLFVPAPFLFYKYGPLIRARSKFAPCIDLVIGKQLALDAENEKLASPGA